MAYWRLLIIVFLGACAMQRYEAQPVSVAANEARFMARSPSESGMREFLAANGVDTKQWPLPRWSLHSLTLLAFYSHPDLDVARAYWDGVRASGAIPTSGVRAIDAGIERHSRHEGVSPWTLSIAFDYAFTGVAKRTAQAQYAQALAQAAQYEIANTAWRVRSALRERLLEHHAALQRERAAQRELSLRGAVQRVLEKRERAGAASQLEVSAARTAQIQASSRAQQAREDVRLTRVALAQAVGISAARLDALVLDTQLFAQIPALNALPRDALKQDALWNRADILQSLSTYDSDEKLLAVEISRQYPDFSIQPGFSWDQEDRVWKLGWGVGLPLPKANTAAIAQARAQRNLQAQRVYALQAKVIGDLEQRTLQYESALNGVAAVERTVETQRERAARAERQLAAGNADTLDVTLAQLEYANAQAQRDDALMVAQRALGALEDALQKPLLGAEFAQRALLPRAKK